jgi:hypothetical protein
MMNILFLFLTVAGAIVALIALDRLLLWMEARGWIYWRKVKPKGGGLAAGLMAMHQLVEPDVRHVREDREQRHVANRADSVDTNVPSPKDSSE